MLRWCACLFLLSSSFAQLGWARSESSAAKAPTAQLPLTTSSPAARINFEKAMLYLEEYRTSQAVEVLRGVVKQDPDFAQALILIAHLSTDPAEQTATRERAKRLAPKVTPGERLLIRWMAGAQENDYLPAIAAMNDLLAEYPQDRRLPFLAGRWLLDRQRYQQAVTVLERALTLHSDYPAALNELAYGYAFCGQFDKAFAAMDRYVALQPDEPNPHDSYGELLRMDGKFDAALEQYRMSIRIDPNFGSDIGVADTLALMGKEEEAREEYARAIIFAGSQSDKIQYELQAAVTWIREGNRKQAEKALADVARHAHISELARLEAEAHRTLALYVPDTKLALSHLQASRNALQESHEISKSDRDEEQALLLRVQATRLAEAGDTDSASQAVQQLEAMAGQSRSQLIQLCYHGAAGAVLSAQGRPAEAISHLEEDSNNPLSMRLLWKAYSGTGALPQAQAIATKLSALNTPTVEQALVVPTFRADLVSHAGRP